MIEFTVPGRARPAGALKIGAKKTGERFLHHRDSSELRDFKNGVRWHAAEAMAGQPPTRGPVAVQGVFYFTRPANHFGTGRNAGRLKDSAPAYPANRAQGDVDKLARGLLDALAGIVFADDSQVATLEIRKRWADEGGDRVEVRVESLRAICERQAAA